MGANKINKLEAVFVGVRFILPVLPNLLGGVFNATNNKSPMEQLAGVRIKPEYNALKKKRFAARRKLDNFRFNS